MIRIQPDDEETVGLRNEETVGLRNEETVGLRNEETVGLRNEETVGLRNVGFWPDCNAGDRLDLNAFICSES